MRFQWPLYLLFFLQLFIQLLPHLEIIPVPSKICVVLAEFPYVFLKSRSCWMLLNLVESTVGQEEVRVVLECHGPVEEVIQLVDIHVEVLLRLHDPMDPALVG